MFHILQMYILMGYLYTMYLSQTISLKSTTDHTELKMCILHNGETWFKIPKANVAGFHEDTKWLQN